MIIGEGSLGFGSFWNNEGYLVGKERKFFRIEEWGSMLFVGFQVLMSHAFKDVTYQKKDVTCFQRYSYVFEL